MIAEQLTVSEMDAVSAHSLDSLGNADENHPHRAKETGRVLCTHGQDFLRMAAEGVEHTGVAFAPQYGATIGGWVRALRALHARVTAEEMIGQVVFLSLK